MISAKATFRPRNDLGRFVEAKVSPAVQASVQAWCEMVQGTAKLYCPVLTGFLQSRITYAIIATDKTVVGTVFVDGVLYAGFVEFGTRFMSAQPYMRPAYDEAKPVTKELFRSQLSTELRG